MSEDYEALAEELEKLRELAVPYTRDKIGSWGTLDAAIVQAINKLHLKGLDPGGYGDYPLVRPYVAALRSLVSARQELVEVFDSDYPEVASIDRALALARSLEEGT